MLRLKEIRKSYKTADFVQVALNDISIAFRDNEFAAILGPSGSGKTTMLNIIGGLDRYDSGDLEIENISTKQYKDSDWDTYRNNRIGFVFQSYNLIPHQSILANVELALTLSGVSASERKKRAKETLTQVGLEEHAHKRPNQLSGGQMQRVAIARALINDPEILLADEPTGALDSTTSVQVLDLLTEIAKERLVIMVTHNRELAEKYANRIVHLKDGEVVSDTRPFDPAIEEVESNLEIRKTRMAFWTAITLSFSNLMTKKGRTFITALAGSIGIIGIAAILALANGINVYIRTVEEETLSLYPLSIQRTGFDLGTMLGDGGGGGGSGGDQPVVRWEERPENEGMVREGRMLTNMFAMRANNDLISLKEYLEANEEVLEPLVNTIHYSFDVTPQIFLADTSDGVVQVNPDPLLAGMGGGGMGGMFGFGMNAFSELVSQAEMITSQYDLLAGHWPTNYDEAILVLTHHGRVPDLHLYAMGLLDREVLEEMMEALRNNTEFVQDDYRSFASFSHEELLAVEFRVVNSFEKFQYDETFNVWVNRSGDTAFMEALLARSIPLRIVGVVKPSPNATVTPLSVGINYTPALITHLMEVAAQAPIVMEQLAYPEVNVTTGRTFVEEQEELDTSFDFSRIISIDEDLIRDTFTLDMDGIDLEFSEMDLPEMDLSGFNIDPSLFQFDISSLGGLSLDLAGMELPPFEMGNIVTEIGNALAGEVQIPTQQLLGVVTNVMIGFIQEAIGSGISDLEELGPLLSAYLARPEVQASIAAQLGQIVAETNLQDQVISVVQNFIQEAIQAYISQMAATWQRQIQNQIEQLMRSVAAQIGSQMANDIANQMGNLASQMEYLALQIGDQMGELLDLIQAEIESAFEQMMGQMQEMDLSALTDAFEIEMGEEEILQLMSTIMQPPVDTYERNLALFGYANPKDPAQISIFPVSFDAKQEIMAILDRYNERMEAQDEPEKVIRYTDLVGAIMSSVTDIINLVSQGLVAFVAISLVVSSIMIGVITYISVLERKKEIGILRAIGASKKNIRQVFNAETLIVGFVAGVLGIALTLVIAEIANVIVYNNHEIERIARLPAVTAVILIGVSMFLTFVAGLLPASAAARKDPIEALRSE